MSDIPVVPVLTLIGIQVCLQVLAVVLLLKSKPQNWNIWIIVSLLGSLIGASIGIAMALTQRPEKDDTLADIDPTRIGELYGS